MRAVRLLLLAALLTGCAAPGAIARPVPPRTIAVALVGVFSGPGGAAGRDLRNGLELEARAIDSAGGLLGARVVVVTADGENDPVKAAELVREQVGDAGVGLVVGPATTAAFLAARGALAAAGVPNCLTRVADSALRGAGSTFLAGPANSAEVTALLDALHRARPEVRAIGLLDGGDELGRSYDALLAAGAGGVGLSYVGHVSAPADADQRPALQQLAAGGAQAVILSQPPEGAARAAQAAFLLGSGRPQLAGFAALADYGVPGVGGDAAVGALLVATPQGYLTSAPPAQWPAGYRAFVSAAGQQYGLGGEGAQPQAAAAGADCLRQWARAVRRAGTFAGAAVSRAWETVDLSADETALGVREHLTPDDHTAVTPDELLAYTWVRDGARYRLKRA